MAKSMFPSRQQRKAMRSVARWGQRIQQGAYVGAINLSPVRRVCRAARAFDVEEGRHLHRLRRRSDKKLDPLKDPLHVDFGAHRWLEGKREEAYSDWLAWILTQPRDLQAVLRILKIETRVATRTCPNYEVEREKPTGEGQEGHFGRIDVVVRLGNNKPILLIECKRKPAEKADLRALAGYARSVRAKHRILLVREADREEYRGVSSPGCGRMSASS